MRKQEIRVTSKPFSEVTPSDFTCCNECGFIRYRLTYQYGPVHLSIVTVPPNKDGGLHGNLGLAGQPTTYEVMFFESKIEEPLNHMTWEQISGFVRHSMQWYSDELDKFHYPKPEEVDNKGW